MNRSRWVLMAGMVSSLCIPLTAGAAEPMQGPVQARVSQPLLLTGPVGHVLIAEEPDESDGAWLGVQLAPVPAAVASQLKLDNAGVMVRNIFKDSPADKAGLERYDVIVRVDDQKVEDGAKTFSKYIKDRKAGDTVKLVFIRGGQEKTAGVTLGETPQAMNDRDLKYKDDPDISSRRMFGLRGKILRPGPNGWIMDDLGELPDLQHFEQFFEHPSRWVEHSPRASEKEGSGDLQEGRRVDKSGRVLQVRKMKDGSVEVSRYDSGTPADKIEVKKYKNMDELRQQDPEAAKMLGASSRPAEELDRLHGRMGRMQNGMRDNNEGMQRYQDEMRDYQNALRDYIRRYRQEGTSPMPAPPPPPKWREWGERFFRPEGPGAMPPQMPCRPEKAEPREKCPTEPPPCKMAPSCKMKQHAKPQATFEVHPDGSITATVDKDGTRLILSFQNEQGMQNQAPKLYERYKETLKSLK